jgi:enolase
MSTITDISGHEILDSRGHPTLSVTVLLADGTTATAAVPSGASTGEREAIELRDGDLLRFRGNGVLKAVAKVRELVSRRLRGMAPEDQAKIDLTLRQLDGTPNKSGLGANTILAVSLAVARAAAATQKLPLYAYIARLAGLAPSPEETEPYVIPVPMITMLNGGAHANNTLDFQEIMLFPSGLPTFAEAVRCGAEIFQTLKELLDRQRLATTIGDAGGYAPNLKTDEQALELVIQAIRLAGYRPGNDVSLAIDVAASGLYNGGTYVFKNSGRSLNSFTTLTELYGDWWKHYPLVSIEDGMGENDREGWKHLTKKLGKKLQLVGDDVFVTNPRIFSRGIRDGIANGILIKPNQIGTLSETLETIGLARTAKYASIIAARSGETEDTFIADLAVGSRAGQIKVGSLCRCERVGKYNRLLAIERELGVYAVYGGKLLPKNAVELRKSPHPVTR